MFVFFAIIGLNLASWVTRTPDIRDMVGASIEQMGLILFGLSAGAMIGILGPGRLAHRLGTRPIIAGGMLLVVVSMVVIGAGATIGSGVMVAIGLMLFGLGVGGGEVALNVEGAAVEQALGKSTLPAIHGAFSIATAAGALLGVFFNNLQIPVLVHCAALTVATGSAFIWAIRTVGPEKGMTFAEREERGPRGSASLLRDRGLLLIGVVILGGAFAEGAANDWLPLILVDGHGYAATSGSLAFAGFAAAMAIGRFGAAWAITKFGRVKVVRASTLVGVLGLVLVIFVDQTAVVAVAVCLWGLGVSVAFPVAISAAGESGPNAAARVSLAATIGYIAFLVGPPVLGFLGEQFGLRGAMLLVVTFMTCAFVAASAMRPAGTPNGTSAGLLSHK